MVDQNGSEPARNYVSIEQAQLGERVTNLGRRQTDLEAEVRTGFRQIEQSIASLSANMAEKNKTPWGVLLTALGVSFTILVYFMTQAIEPVRGDQTDLKQSIMALAAETNQSIRSLSEKAVTRDELNWRSARGAEDRDRTDKAIDDIRAAMLPRNEWSERNQSRDHEIVSLQRQIDLQRSDFQSFSNSLGNGRDFIVDLKAEVGRLRDQLAEIRARQYQRLNVGPPQ